MKRITVMFVIALSVLVLAGCGGSGSNSASSAQENPGDVYRVITVDESGAPVKAYSDTTDDQPEYFIETPDQIIKLL